MVMPDGRLGVGTGRMNRDETQALYAQGKDAWNAWAAKMLSQRQAVEAAGTWAVEKDRFGTIEPNNEATTAWFKSAAAEFSTAKAPYEFKNTVDFSGWVFPADAGFEKATFPGTAWFGEATFLSNAVFEKATFSGDAGFEKATFSGTAWFGEATFWGDAGLEKVTFEGDARFENVTFTRDARFENATFSGTAWFGGATFTRDARFNGATLRRHGRFEKATFTRHARFGGAMFSGDAGFGEVTFNGFTSFADTSFDRDADFSGIRSERAFTLAGATFRQVPDFVQAHFEEAPRLDNSLFRLRPVGLFDGQEDAPARYRALKRLAIQGHDHESEMKFFAGEITRARFVTDFPLTWRIWSGEAWGGVARWWFGWGYQLVSGFGRSLLRPLVLWLVTIALGTGYFLGQHPDVERARTLADKDSSIGIATYAVASWAAWTGSQPCYALTVPKDKPDQYISGLAEGVRAQTSAATEAMHLALRNAFIFLDGGADAAHRTFGCLYGVERYGDNPVAIVPSNVSFASALQKAFSGVLIFLFGLGVRNMLRMK